MDDDRNQPIRNAPWPDKLLLVGRDPILERLHTIFESWQVEVLHVHDWTPDELMVTMIDFRPDTVINGSSTNTDQPDAFVANSKGPAIVGLYAAAIDAHLYHLSDSSVFSGRTEMSSFDAVYPTNVYGLSRMLGERAVRSYNSNATIIRFGWLYGQECEGTPPNIAVDQALGLRKSALVYSDSYGSPTFIGDAATILAHHVVGWHEPYLLPVVHIAPKAIVSWADLLEHAYPKVEPTTVRSSPQFRDLRRNEGLIPTEGWVVPAGGLARFQTDLNEDWDFNNTVGTYDWDREMYANV